MSRSAHPLLNVFRSLFEQTVNLALDVVAPPRRPAQVPVLALADREWQRAAAKRRRFNAH